MVTLEELKAQYRREDGDSSATASAPALDEQAAPLLGRCDEGSEQARERATGMIGVYPLTLRFPADARVATIAGRWRRLPDGMIEATFNTQEELAWALVAMGCDRPEVMEVLQ